MNATRNSIGLILFTLAMIPSLSLAAGNFDGQYNGTVTCGKNPDGAAGVTFIDKVVISGNNLKNSAPVTDPAKWKWDGKIVNSDLQLNLKSDNGHLEIKLAGKIISTDAINASGEWFFNGQKRRDCTAVFANSTSVPAQAANQKTIATAPPVLIPAKNSLPERSAAIGNVNVPFQANVGQGVQGQPTQVTTNPIDLQKKTNPNEVWISFNPSVTVQQRQFCRIIENFRTENAIALQTRNQIKVNETFRNLVQSLISLLPDGKFQGWVMRTVYVSQASDGSAEVLLELPCNVYVGSNACDVNPQNYYGTVPEGSRIYTELAKMTIGDFAITSGKFVYADEKAFDKKRSVASFGYMKTANHCTAKKIASDSDFFGLALDAISTIK